MAQENSKNLKRPPVVVVVGHVDHGKTSLLDYIRKTNVAGKEAGGITQSVGAYEIEHGGKKITFIDTPGHEAFSKMRVRGAHVADIGILVVAADEGVKPQTKEALKALQDSETPFVVAMTKIDKPNADLDRVKNDLTANNVLLEGYGGNVSYQGVSSKTGEGVNELLDLILLTSDLEDLHYRPEHLASGIVLETKLDKQRGNTITVILKDGVLRRSDLIITPSARGKIKILENFLGKPVNELLPSSPAVILGFEILPEIGEEFMAGQLSEKDLGNILKRGLKELKVKINSKAKKFLIESSNGDARVLLNVLEITSNLAGVKPDHLEGVPGLHLTINHIEQALQRRQLTFDKQGEEFYNVISAFIKSMRASNVDSALYYLARMVEAGQDPLYIARRMVVFASEDIGMAQPTALVVANEVFRACETIGYPECQINLMHAVVYLATAKKSRLAYDAYFRAVEDVKKFGNLPVPLNIRNAPTNLMKELGYGKGYEAYSKESLLPDKLKNKKYYKP